MDGKGQMFLIAAIVIVSAIVILGFNVSSPSASKEVEAMKATFEAESFENVMSEFNATIDLSSNAPENITSNVVDFAGFAQSNTAGRSATLALLFVGTVANKTTEKLHVSVLNMLGYSINASLDANAQTATNSSVPIDGEWNTTFTMTPGDTYLMNITYNAEAGSATKETIEIKTKNNKDTYTGFFYVRMAGASANHVSKYQKYINLK